MMSLVDWLLHALSTALLLFCYRIMNITEDQLYEDMLKSGYGHTWLNPVAI